MGDSTGRSTNLPPLNVAQVWASATRCGAFTARHWSWAASLSLNAMTSTGGAWAGHADGHSAVPDDGEGRLNRVREAWVDLALGGAVERRQQYFEVIGGLRRGPAADRFRTG